MQESESNIKSYCERIATVLDKAGVQYAALDQAYWENWETTDLDILTPNPKQAAAIILKELSTPEFLPAGRIFHKTGVRLNFILPSGQVFSGPDFILAPTISTPDSLSKKLKQYLRDKQSGIFSLTPELTFVSKLLRRIEKGDYPDSKMNALRDMYLSNSETIAHTIKDVWQQKEADKIRCIFENKDWLSLKRLGNNLLCKRSICSRLKLMAWVIFSRAVRVCRPAGITVAFLGPDGVGKSTLIERVKIEVEKIALKPKYYHFRPGFLGKRNALSANDMPHAKPPYGKFFSYLKAIYLVFDYWLSYILIVIPGKAKRHCFIFDRYFCDLMVDPYRYRYGGAPMFICFLNNFIPQPDIVFILSASVEQIRERKKELTFEEISRQLDLYSSLSRRMPNSVIIDTSVSVKQSVKYVFDPLLEKVREKTIYGI